MGLFKIKTSISRPGMNFCDEPEEPDQHLRIGNDRIGIKFTGKKSGY